MARPTTMIRREGRQYEVFGGYRPGDFLVSPDNSVGSNGSFSVSSQDTWTNKASFHRDLVVWDDMFPGSVQGAAQALIVLSRGAGETVDVRLRNTVDGETIATDTGLTSSQTVVLGPATYTPTTTASAIDVRVELQTSGGTASSLTGISTGYGPQR